MTTKGIARLASQLGNCINFCVIVSMILRQKLMRDALSGVLKYWLPPPPTLLCYCRWRASTWSRRPTSWSLSSIAAGSFLNRLLRWAESFWINFMSFLYKQFLLSYVVRGKVDSIDEGFIQKQRSALLFGGQNWFNSLPQYRFCARMIWRNGHGWIEKWTLGGMDASEHLDDLPVHTTPNHHPPKVDVFPKKNSSNHPSC